MGFFLKLGGFILVLFFGMLAFTMVGHRLGRRYRDRGGGDEGLGAIEGAIFALMGLLIAFTFSGALERFDSRRALIIEEANALSTAYDRLDMLPEPTRTNLHDALRTYLDTRLAAYAVVSDPASVARQIDAYTALQQTIWQQATAAATASAIVSTPMLVLPPLNVAFDLARTRLADTTIHPPSIIFIMLGTLTLVSAMLAGFAMSKNPLLSRLHVLGFAALLTFTVCVIVNLEYPRRGFIRVDATDQVLRDVRARMR